jgi:hypothetical protein
LFCRNQGAVLENLRAIGVASRIGNPLEQPILFCYVATESLGGPNSIGFDDLILLPPYVTTLSTDGII